MNKYNTYGEYGNRYQALKHHPNAIVRKHKQTGLYVVFYYYSVYEQAKREGCVK